MTPPFYALVALNQQVIRLYTGKYQEAPPVAQRALAVAKATRGPGHLDVANPLNNLGSVVALAVVRVQDADASGK